MVTQYRNVIGMPCDINLLTDNIGVLPGGGSSGGGGTTPCGNGRLNYDGTYVAISNDISNCLDRDYDGHKSIFCGGTDLNDLNSSVNPDMDEICGDGFDNNQVGQKDYEDRVNCPHASNPVTYHVDPVNGINSQDRNGSETDPFRTINYVNSFVKSGNTVLLHEGDYGDINNTDIYYSINNLSFKRNKINHTEAMIIMLQTSMYRFTRIIKTKARHCPPYGEVLCRT